MKKRLTLICLLFFGIAGVKAQTYCYHCYKMYDEFDVPKTENSYGYVTFKGDYLYPSEKDGSYQISAFDRKPSKNLYKCKTIVNGALLYAKWDDTHNEYAENVTFYIFPDKYTYFLIATDKSEINYIHNGYTSPNGNLTKKPYTFCYERCPNRDCETTKGPSMKH
ncbi:MAG: hypothetical protein IJK78_03330 [Bacteroidales bacterium]|nr:hypothetical protein [Bacteroidales bacterium]